MAPRAPQKRLKTKKRVFLVIGDPNGLPKKFSAIFGAGCRKVCCCSLNGANCCTAEIERALLCS